MTILAGVGEDNARGRAVKYNRSINGDLQHKMINMTTNVLGMMDKLTSNSSVYTMYMKPLVDGVTVNNILKNFDIESIDYQKLQAETDVKGYIENIEDVEQIFASQFANEKGEVTLESVFSNIKKGVSFSKTDVDLIKKIFQRYSDKINSYEIDILQYFKVTHRVDYIDIQFTDEGYNLFIESFEESLEILHSKHISGIYKVGDSEYTEIKAAGKLSDISKYMEIGGVVIDTTLMVDALNREDYSDVGSALGGLTVGLIGYGVMNSWNPTGWVAGVVGVGIVGLTLVGSKVGENIGNSIESNEDWFGDGID